MIEAHVHRPRVTLIGMAISGAYLLLMWTFIRSLELQDTYAIFAAWVLLLVGGAVPVAYAIGNFRAVIPVRANAEGLHLEGDVLGEPRRRVWAWDDVTVTFHARHEHPPEESTPAYTLAHRTRGRLVVMPRTHEGLGRLTGQMLKHGVVIRRA